MSQPGLVLIYLARRRVVIPSTQPVTFTFDSFLPPLSQLRLPLTCIMPIRTAPASSSRQPTRGRGVSDPIEDDEDDADVQPAARNKGKGRAAPPAGLASGVNGNGVNGVDGVNGHAVTSSGVVEEEGWTVQTFQPRPVTRAGPTITSVSHARSPVLSHGRLVSDGSDGSDLRSCATPRTS